MSTLNQIRANQQNAQLSTGPRSVETKAVTRRNALKSGIYAAPETALASEKAEDLEILKNQLYDQFDPATPVERDLVDDLIRDRWLLRRFAFIEDQLLNENSQDRSLGQFYGNLDQTLSRLARRITATRKSYKETVAFLEKQQAARVARVPNPRNSEPSQEPQPDPLPVSSESKPVAVSNLSQVPDSSAPKPLAISKQPGSNQSGQDLSYEPDSSAEKPVAVDLSHVQDSSAGEPLAIGSVSSTVPKPEPKPAPYIPAARL